MTSIGDVIGHYQRSIEKSAHDEARLLHCIEKLYKLPITVEHLQQTGIGKTVNSLRKYDKEVGVAAKTLVAKWKAMVAAEEDIADEEDDNGERHSDDGGDDQDGDRRNGHSHDRHNNNGRHESPSKRHHDKTVSSTNSDKTERRHKEEHRRHNSSHSSDRHSRDKSSSNENSSKSSNNKYPKETEHHRKNGKIHEDRRRDEKATVNFDSKLRLKEEPDSDHDHNRVSDEEDEEKLIIDTEKEVKVEPSSKHSKSSHDKSSSRSSKSSSSRKEHHKHDRDKENDKTDSSKRFKSSSPSSSSSSPTKMSKSNDKIDKSKSDDDHRHKSDRKDEEKSSRINGIHKSSSSSSTSSKTSTHHNNSKDSKESDRKHKSSSSSSSKSSSSRDKDKSSSSKDREKSSSSKDDDRKSSSKRKHEHAESSNSDEEQNVPKKTKTKPVLDGIDSSAGMFSFEEALGIMAPPAKPSKSKSSSKVNGSQSSPSLSSTPSPSKSSTPSRSGSSSSSSRSKTPPLLTTKVRLEPLDPKLSLELPTISNNYKPLPLNQTVMDCVFAGSSTAKPAPPKRTMTDAEALQSGIQSKTIRTKIYSGVRTGQLHQVPTLHQMCIRVLQKNIDALEYTGDVPYYILKPVLELATPPQLQIFEEYNPYILIETDELWEKHCNRRFKAYKREEMESWREMFLRCHEIEEQRLSALTKNITKQQKQIAAPVRRTQLAYVDVDVKPPRNVQRKQEQYGTKGKMIATPAARVEALSKITPTAAKVGDTRLRVAAADRDFAQASSNNRPKKAPLMQKTLQLMRGRFKR